MGQGMGLTPEQRAELRQVAEAATNSEWQVHEELTETVCVRWNENHWYMDAIHEEDAAHIAAFDPPTVLALLDRIAQLERERDEALAKLGNGSCWDEGPVIPTFDGCEDMPPSCELVAGHAGAHRSGQTEWMRNEASYNKMRKERDEARADVKRLKAQVRSLQTPANPAGVAKPEERPDDSEADAAIAAAEDFAEAIWEIGDKYEVALTNNLERWQEGQFLRHTGDFLGDIRSAAEKHLLAPVADRARKAEAALERVTSDGFADKIKETVEHNKFSSFVASDGHKSIGMSDNADYAKHILALIRNETDTKETP